MFETLPVVLLERILSYLSLAPEDGAVALCATCRYLNNVVREFAFDELALEWHPASKYWKERRAYFPGSFRNVEFIESWQKQTKLPPNFSSKTKLVFLGSKCNVTDSFNRHGQLRAINHLDLIAVSGEPLSAAAAMVIKASLFPALESLSISAAFLTCTNGMVPQMLTSLEIYVKEPGNLPPSQLPETLRHLRFICYNQLPMGLIQKELPKNLESVEIIPRFSGIVISDAVAHMLKMRVATLNSLQKLVIYGFPGLLSTFAFPAWVPISIRHLMWHCTPPPAINFAAFRQSVTPRQNIQSLSMQLRSHQVETLPVFERCKRLHLILSSVDDYDIDLLLSKFPDLRDLRIQGVSCSALMKFPSALKDSRIKLAVQCNVFNNRDFDDLPSSLNQLWSLEIVVSSDVTGRDELGLANRFINLRHLRISGFTGRLLAPQHLRTLQVSLPSIADIDDATFLQQQWFAELAELDCVTITLNRLFVRTVCQVISRQHNYSCKVEEGDAMASVICFRQRAPRVLAPRRCPTYQHLVRWNDTGAISLRRDGFGKDPPPILC